MRYLILLAGVLVVIVLLVSRWSDEGEVITLVTFDAEAQEFETGLWIVEVDGAPYLRAYSLQSAWLRRLTAIPDVQLTRDGEKGWYRATAVDDDVLRERVSEAMGDKYGRLNQATQWFRDPSGSVPIRLEPLGEDHTIGAAQ